MITQMFASNMGGGRYSITGRHAFPEEVSGVFRVAYDPNSGHFLTRDDDISPVSGKVYGPNFKIAEKIALRFRSHPRSLGAMFCGMKGTGKSLTAVETARRVSEEFGIPVIKVESASPGLPEFLSTLGSCVILFDEFEKNFPNGSYNEVDQEDFLSLFDGTDSIKRMYLITTNSRDNDDITPFMLNRPGRIHYLVDFNCPTTQDIIDYLRNESKHATEAQIDEVATISMVMTINYDNLRAISTEIDMLDDPTLSVREIISDMNIGREPIRFDITVIGPGANFVVSECSIDFTDPNGKIYIYRACHGTPLEGTRYLSFDPGSLEIDKETGDVVGRSLTFSKDNQKGLNSEDYSIILTRV